MGLRKFERVRVGVYDPATGEVEEVLPAMTVTYMVEARSKAEAIAKGRALAEAAGHTVVAVVAERFKGGADYRVNWRVEVEVPS